VHRFICAQNDRILLESDRIKHLQEHEFPFKRKIPREHSGFHIERYSIHFNTYLPFKRRRATRRNQPFYFRSPRR
jgi:hypothetical protein